MRAQVKRTNVAAMMSAQGGAIDDVWAATAKYLKDRKRKCVGVCSAAAEGPPHGGGGERAARRLEHCPAVRVVHTRSCASLPLDSTHLVGRTIVLVPRQHSRLSRLPPSPSPSLPPPPLPPPPPVLLQGGGPRARRALQRAAGGGSAGGRRRSGQQAGDIAAAAAAAAAAARPAPRRCKAACGHAQRGRCLPSCHPSPPTLADVPPPPPTSPPNCSPPRRRAGLTPLPRSWGCPTWRRMPPP